MSSYGSKILCPSCGKQHIVRVGEIKELRQIEFACSKCGKAVSIASSEVPVISSTNPPVRAKIRIMIVE